MELLSDRVTQTSDWSDSTVGPLLGLLEGPDGVPGIETGFAVCKASSLPTVPFLLSQELYCYLTLTCVHTCVPYYF